jgi:hypothetical protein
MDVGTMLERFPHALWVTRGANIHSKWATLADRRTLVPINGSEIQRPWIINTSSDGRLDARAFG